MACLPAWSPGPSDSPTHGPLSPDGLEKSTQSIDGSILGTKEISFAENMAALKGPFLRLFLLLGQKTSTTT